MTKENKIHLKCIEYIHVKKTHSFHEHCKCKHILHVLEGDGTGQILQKPI